MIGEATRTRQENFTDKIGQEVKVGDTIAYGHALGRCAALRIGKVLKIELIDSSWAIQVQGIDDDGLGLRLCKPGALQFPDRVVKLTTPIPEEYAKILWGSS